MTQPRSTFEQFIGTPGNDRIYEQGRLLVEATELIANVLETTQMTRGELARRLGRSIGVRFARFFAAIRI